MQHILDQCGGRSRLAITLRAPFAWLYTAAVACVRVQVHCSPHCVAPTTTHKPLWDCTTHAHVRARAPSLQPRPLTRLARQGIMRAPLFCVFFSQKGGAVKKRTIMNRNSKGKLTTKLDQVSIAPVRCRRNTAVCPNALPGNDARTDQRAKVWRVFRL